jgi:aryl-alcohol dehydrogenase-like predicted oxidoreductase
MELRRLGNSGLKVSALSLGAMTFGESETFMKGYPYDFIAMREPW